jgi:sec-independent protein translocase protein TatC
VVGILVLAALVTPPDVITQVILFVVVYGLYELSIWLVRRVETKREAQLRAEGYYDEEEEFDEAVQDEEVAEDPLLKDDPLMKEFDEDSGNGASSDKKND